MRRRSRSLIRLEPLVTGIRKNSGKDEYDHYMKKEIHEQLESLAMTAQVRTLRSTSDLETWQSAASILLVCNADCKAQALSP